MLLWGLFSSPCNMVPWLSNPFLTGYCFAKEKKATLRNLPFNCRITTCCGIEWCGTERHRSLISAWSSLPSNQNSIILVRCSKFHMLGRKSTGCWGLQKCHQAKMFHKCKGNQECVPLRYFLHLQRKQTSKAIYLLRHIKEAQASNALFCYVVAGGDKTSTLDEFCTDNTAQRVTNRVGTNNVTVPRNILWKVQQPVRNETRKIWQYCRLQTRQRNRKSHWIAYNRSWVLKRRKEQVTLQGTKTRRLYCTSDKVFRNALKIPIYLRRSISTNLCS